jgi:hypothetical protein
MDLTLKDNLPFIVVTVVYQSTALAIPHVLVDTGSASTIFAADVVASLGIVPQPTDLLRTIQGVGGEEVVFTRRIDNIQVDNQDLHDLEIEIGGMDYGFEINGILGMDFLGKTGAIINLREMKLEFSN